MSTRAVVYVHNGYEQSKLYHHHDGYVDWLGMNLIEAMRKYDGYLLKTLSEIPGFEFDNLNSYHGDVEYIYHIHMNYNNGNTSWRLTVQTGFNERRILLNEEHCIAYNDGEITLAIGEDDVKKVEEILSKENDFNSVEKNEKIAKDEDDRAKEHLKK